MESEALSDALVGAGRAPIHTPAGPSKVVASAYFPNIGSNIFADILFSLNSAASRGGGRRREATQGVASRIGDVTSLYFLPPFFCTFCTVPSSVPLITLHYHHCLVFVSLVMDSSDTL